MSARSYSSITSKRGIIVSLPQRCISRACRPSSARVQAQPRLGSPSSCASSSTATSYIRLRSHISTVQLVWPASSSVTSSWPVTKLHRWPSALRRVCTSHANNRNGAQYTLCIAPFSALIAALRCILRAAGYHSCGIVRSANSSSSSSCGSGVSLLRTLAKPRCCAKQHRAHWRAPKARIIGPARCFQGTQPSCLPGSGYAKSSEMQAQFQNCNNSDSLFIRLSCSRERSTAAHSENYS
eukprot:11406-Heterococcus_DN1.PRE.1